MRLLLLHHDICDVIGLHLDIPARFRAACSLRFDDVIVFGLLHRRRLCLRFARLHRAALNTPSDDFSGKRRILVNAQVAADPSAILRRIGRSSNPDVQARGSVFACALCALLPTSTAASHPGEGKNCTEDTGSVNIDREVYCHFIFRVSVSAGVSVTSSDASGLLDVFVEAFRKKI